MLLNEIFSNWKDQVSVMLLRKFHKAFIFDFDAEYTVITKWSDTLKGDKSMYNYKL